MSSIQLPILYNGQHSIIYYQAQSHYDGPVSLKVLKTPKPQQHVQLLNEYELTKDLNSPGIRKAYDLVSFDGQLALALEYVAGISLKEMLQTQRPGLPVILEVAISILQAIHEIHQQRIIHKNINSTNIIVNPETDTVKVIDFGIAAQIDLKTYNLGNPNLLEGTLSYIAPEQTGRMNRVVDNRADLYSFGVTLYELFTGQLPFETTDVLKLVYDHLATTPIPPYQVNPEIPPILSEIVMKLLAKNADERYQSAYGVKSDLERYLQTKDHAPGGSGTLSEQSFELAQHDLPGRFRLPQKLYGREQELETLLAAFDRVSTHGTPEIVLVSGYSGIGKSSLVHEVHKPITGKNGLFISGKFDQFHHNEPYYALRQAFDEFVTLVLTEAEACLHQWQQRIMGAVGNLGQVLLDVIPRVQLVIGKQSPVAEIGPLETQNRFQMVFQNFLTAIARADHPIVLFLDDMQRADAASLVLLKAFLSDPEIQHLLVILAYRDNEVQSGHPLLAFVDDLQSGGTSITTLPVENLTLSQINMLLADTFRCEPAYTQPLTEMVYAKTGGNAFFTTQLLNALNEEQSIRFDPHLHSWIWDQEQIQAQKLSANVAELMTRKLRKLPALTQEVLSLAACIGNTFDLGILAIIYTKTPEQTLTDLWPAIEEHIVLPFNEQYKYVTVRRKHRAISDASDGAEEIEHREPLTSDVLQTPEMTGAEDEQIRFRFLHDWVQQSAYNWINEDRKTTVHLQIGRLLWQRVTAAEMEEHLFAIVRQLNHARALITDAEELQRLAELNQRAGKKARDAAAYQAAREFFQQGVACLPEHPWKKAYPLTLALHTQWAEAAYIARDFEEAERLFHVTLSQARTALDRVAVYNLQIDYYWSQRNLKWVDTGRTVLAELGVALPAKHFKLVALLELIKIQLLMRGRTPLILLQLPAMTDAHKQAAMQILVRLGGPAMDNLPDLLSVTTMYLVRLSLRYGNAPFSGVGFGMYGLLLLTLGFGKVDDVYALVKTLTEQTDMQAGAFLQWFGYAGFAAHYKEPLRATWPLLQKVMTLCLERGEFNWYGCVLYIYLNHRLISGDPLDQLLDEFAHLAPLLKKFRVEHFEESVRIWWQLLLTLSGTSAATWQLTGPIWDETTESPRLMAEKKEAVWDYYFSQLWLAWLTEDWSAGLDYCRKIAQWKQKLRLGYGPAFDLFYGICAAEQATTAQGTERRRLLFRLWRCRRRLRKLAQHCVANYQHKYLLLAAESARLQGKLRQAMQCYDEAIAGARQHQFLHEEALANERAACFYLYLGRETIATTYLQAARTCYARWGCFPKVKLLEETYPHLIGQFAQVVTAQTTNLPETAVIQTTETVDPQGSILDVATLLKASQALAQEVRLDHLLHRIMQLMLENAGADRGVLLLKEEEEWLIQAHASPGMAIRVLQRIPLHSIAQRSERFLSTAIAEYVMRTHESLVLEDAVNDSHFGRDSYVQRYQAKSLLCQPLVHQGRLTGLLYLENTLTTNAFTPQRLELLNSLVSYAAISLENAHLYAELAEHSRSLEQRVTERTRELEQSNRALQQAQAAAEAASRAKSTFLAHISHELRTPLTGILGYTQLLRRDQGLTDKQQKAVASIRRSGEHLLLLINDLLDLSKIESQKMELTPHSFPLPQFLRNLVETIRIRARPKDITLNAEIPADLPAGVYADERRLRQILVNLLNNAVKFTEKGSVTLRVSYRDREMGRWGDGEMGRRSDGEVGSISPHPPISPSPHLRFEVEDTGIGIPPEHLHQIFTSFYQVKNFSRQEGSGLGLTICQQLVRLMGSELYAKSTVGQGSTFWFDLELPVTEDITTNVVPPDCSIIGFTGARRKILVVDDNPENREFLCDVLFSLTFELREAANGREAIEITREWQPHLILMDLVMPVMDGFEATRQIRKLETENSMLDTGYSMLDTDTQHPAPSTQHPAPSIQYPVIIGVSANILESIGQKSFAVGCDDFLTKPIDIAQLLNCLQQYLQLEWLYSDASERESGSPQTSKARPFTVPPPDVLGEILDLAEDGDMTDLHQCLTKLKIADPRFIPFVERIEQLADRFQFEQIVELIQQVKS